jgi:hypothetical protein
MRVIPEFAQRNIPSKLEICKSAPTKDESDEAFKTREDFLFPGDSLPYMQDIIRGMRLTKGLLTYVEVGTYDKGCLAYVSDLLSPEAIIVDVDIDENTDQEIKLRKHLKPHQRYHKLVGDSTSDEILQEVKSIIGPSGADIIFIDANHIAEFVWNDVSQYFELLSENGILLVHDILWSGDESHFGSDRAIEWIDKFLPVFCIEGTKPIYRYFPSFSKSESHWGVLGVILK